MYTLSLAVCAVGTCLVIGEVLRQVQLISVKDGEIGLKFALQACLPLIICPILSAMAEVQMYELIPILLAVPTISALTFVLGWLCFGNRFIRERNLLLGLCQSSDTQLFAFPFVYAVYGVRGVFIAVCYTVLQFIYCNFLSFLLLRSCGTVFPARYVHDDGGVYKGEWKGRTKDGLGRYEYPNKAIFEGQWCDNQKQGYGLYRYAKGGYFKGQWMGNNPNGIGIRVYSSGKIKEGFWKDGKLAQELESSSCFSVAQTTNSLVNAVRRIKLGIPGMEEGVLTSMLSPMVLAFGFGAIALLYKFPIPVVVDEASRILLSFSIPLGIISTTICRPSWNFISPQTNRDTVMVMCIKLCATMLYGFFYFQWARYNQVDVGTIIVLCALGPIQHLHLLMAESYRLNGPLMQNLFSTSIYTSFFLSVVVAVLGSPYLASVKMVQYGYTILFSLGFTGLLYGSFSSKKQVAMVYVGKGKNNKVVNSTQCCLQKGVRSYLGYSYGNQCGVRQLRKAGIVGSNTYQFSGMPRRTNCLGLWGNKQQVRSGFFKLCV